MGNFRNKKVFRNCFEYNKDQEPTPVSVKKATYEKEQETGIYKEYKCKGEEGSTMFVMRYFTRPTYTLTKKCPDIFSRSCAYDCALILYISGISGKSLPVFFSSVTYRRRMRYGLYLKNLQPNHKPFWYTQGWLRYT